MSAGFWFWFWLAVLVAFINVLYGMWLLGRFELMAESAREPHHPSATVPPVKPVARATVVRHQHFNQVRREAVAAALKDFGGRVRTSNPYLVGSAAHATWASHYDRIMYDQFTLELARLEADAMERA